VAPDANALLDHAVAAPNATIAFYADDGADAVRTQIQEAMTKNLRWQGVLVFTVSERVKDDALAAVRDAVEDGSCRW
jgi:NADPH2:quinone reductase